MQSKKAIRKSMRLLVGIGATLCLMVAGLLLPALPANAAAPVIPVVVSVSAPATVGPGDYFTANVNISTVVMFDTSDFEVVVDPSVLEIENPASDVTDGQIGGTTIPVTSAVPKATPGTYKIVVNVPGFPGVNGSGYLCQIEFHVLGAAGTSSAINLQNGMLGDVPPVGIDATWTGTTVSVAVIDATKPTVTVGTPTGSDVPINTVVTATFSEAMNTGSAQGAFSMSPVVAGSFGWVGNVMTFDPTLDLDYDTKYTATITTAAQDLSANALARVKSWSFTTIKAPYLVVTKTVNPGTIGRKGSGLAPEESTVTLTVTGAGDPAGGPLTVVVVTDVLPDYINLEGNIVSTPATLCTQTPNANGTTTLRWNVVAPIVVGTTWTVSFDISSDDCGRVLANEYSTSNVVYFDTASVPVAVTEVFPKTYLVVRCPEEGVSCVTPPGGDAEMSIQNISVNGEEFVQTQEIEVTVSVGNSGGTEGAKTVSLYINGVFEDSQSVTVGPGSGQNVLFRVVGRVVPGTYTVSVEGREAQFTVLGMGPPQSAPAPPMAVAGLGGGLGTAGMIAIIVVIVALGIGLVVILRREST